MLKNLALRALVAIQGLSAKVQDEEGQTLAEYGLIMAVIAVAVIVAAGVLFRDAIIRCVRVRHQLSRRHLLVERNWFVGIGWGARRVCRAPHSTSRTAIQGDNMRE